MLRAAFVDAVGVYRRHWKALLGAAFLLQFLPSFIDGSFSLDSGGTEIGVEIPLIGAIVGIVFYLWFFGVVVVITYRDCQGLPAPMIASITEVLSKLHNIILAQIVPSIFTCLGCFFFIIPAIYISMRYIFTLPITVIEKCAPASAYEYSWKITRGYVGSLLFVNIVLITLPMLPFLVGWATIDGVEYKIGPMLYFENLASRLSAGLIASILVYLSNIYAQIIICLMYLYVRHGTWNLVGIAEEFGEGEAAADEVDPQSDV